ncbi:cleft lip and palate transmembrane 1 [Ramicandelaber brevisporus]|nr:cleft lip and palate transmembrane 1 [Ramicandelaber brevisporus]
MTEEQQPAAESVTKKRRSTAAAASSSSGEKTETKEERRARRALKAKAKEAAATATVAAAATTSTAASQQQPQQEQQEQQEQQAEQEQSPWDTLMTMLPRMILLYMVFQYFSNSTGGGGSGTNQTTSSNSPSAGADSGNATDTLPVPATLKPLWPLGTNLSLNVFLLTGDVRNGFGPQGAEYRVGDNVSSAIAFGSNSTVVRKPIWEIDNIVYGDWAAAFKQEIDVELPAEVLANKTAVFVEAVVCQKDSSLLDRCAGVSHPLITYLKKTKPAKLRKLIGDGQEEEENEDDKDKESEGDSAKKLSVSEPAVDASSTADATKTQEATKTSTSTSDSTTTVQDTNLLTPMLVPEVGLTLLTSGDALPYKSLPPFIRDFVLRASQNHTHYVPTLFVNNFWVMSSTFIPINSTLASPAFHGGASIPVRFTFDPLSLFKFQTYLMMEHNARQQASMGFGGTHSLSQMDEIKRIFLETNPWLLLATCAVTLFHSLFSFLAFKNDVQFWRAKKDTVGVSLRSMIIDFVSKLIIYLYLYDNRVDTSMMIMMTEGIALVIELWKIKKAANAHIEHESASSSQSGGGDRKIIKLVGGWQLILPAESSMSQEELATRDADVIAHKYMYRFGIPVFIIYFIYSLLYQRHKSWYSFVLTTCVGFINMFGFCTMIPPLVVNHRLKSVAHMSHRAMTYKFLNTIVDDMFSFVVSMPTWHRIAVFRDDVVFVIYLWQKWTYPTDYSRANEFGQVYDESSTAEGKEQPTEEEKETRKTQ